MRSGKFTLALIAANVLFFALSFALEEFWGFRSYLAFGLNPYFFEGMLWQLLSSFFMHGGIAHLAMNMAVLYQFGGILERSMGGVKFTLLYIAGGLLTSALCLIYVRYALSRGELVNIVGASGAICVLLGFIACFDRRGAGGIFVAILLMSFAPMLMGINVAWYAHIAGFAVGYGFGLIQKRFRIS